MGPLRRFPFMPGTTSLRRLNTARSQQRRQRKSGAGEGRLSGCIHENSSDGGRVQGWGMVIMEIMKISEDCYKMNVKIKI